jgi:hypothetical protein
MPTTYIEQRHLGSSIVDGRSNGEAANIGYLAGCEVEDGGGKGWEIKGKACVLRSRSDDRGDGMGGRAGNSLYSGPVI